MTQATVTPRSNRSGRSPKRAVTWSVRNKSALAFLLVGTLFTLGAKLTETPITAMFRLIDGPGQTDQNGNTLFSYAHAIFSAPFTLVGDGG